MKIYNKFLVLCVLVLFVGIFTSPLLFNINSWGTGKPGPDPVVLEKAGENCVESKEYMKTSHMLLLDEWRTAVVRDGDRTYTSANGTPVEMSLSNTCMDCHSNKSQFCDRCHDDYMDITPYCWDCHIAPTEPSEQQETEK